MAIIKCKECKNPVSSEAKLCPHCGIKKPKPSLGCLPLILVVIAVGYFSGKFTDDNASAKTNNTPNPLGLFNAPKVDVSPISTKPFTEVQVCASTISMIFGTPLKEIKTKTNSNNIHYISYKRKSDKTIWEYKCKLSGDNVIWTWTGDKRDPDSWFGKGLVDSLVTFSVKDKTLEIVEIQSNNSINKETFSIK